MEQISMEDYGILEELDPAYIYHEIFIPSIKKWISFHNLEEEILLKAKSLGFKIREKT